MKNKIYFYLGCLSFALASAVMQAQNLGISASGAAPSGDAGLDVNFSDKGVLIPRVNLTSLTSYAPITGGPVGGTESMLVYNTNTTTGKGYYYWNGSRWVKLLVTGVPADAWLITGNAGTTAGTHFVGTTDNVDLVFKTNNTERMRILNSGWIGMATSTPTTLIHFNPTSPPNQFLTAWDNSTTNGALARFYHTNTGNGNRVLFGITNYNASAFQAPGLIGLHLSTTGSGGVGVQGTTNSSAATGIFAGNQNNPVITTGWALYANNWAGGVTAWQNISDERLKKNVKIIEHPIDIIKKIRGVEYYFNTEVYRDLNLPDEKQYGFIAQEVEKVMPEIVRNAKIPGNQNLKMTADIKQEIKFYDFKAMSYSYIIPVLVEAIKEQQQQIEKLQTELKKLKEKN
jgi:ribosomal protein S13